MFKEFKEFILTGNVMDLAVGVILGAAVGNVVNGFVTKIAMPIIGHFAGGIDFSSKKIVLDPAELDATGKIIKPENIILYGDWISSIISLITVGFVLFIIVKAYNKMRKPMAVPVTEIDLLTEIRDVLKK